jgi:hypothetical protein
MCDSVQGESFVMHSPTLLASRHTKQDVFDICEQRGKERIVKLALGVQLSVV